MVRSAAEAQAAAKQAAAKANVTAAAQSAAPAQAAVEEAVGEEGDGVVRGVQRGLVVGQVKSMPSLPGVPSLPTPAYGAEPSSDQEGLPSPAGSSSSADTPASGSAHRRQSSRGTSMADVLALQKRNRGPASPRGGPNSPQVTSPVTSPKLTSSPSSRGRFPERRRVMALSIEELL